VDVECRVVRFRHRESLALSIAILLAALEYLLYLFLWM
jgi:hypothetical protein